MLRGIGAIAEFDVGLRSMLPVIVAQLVVTMKDTALGFIITYPELLYYAKLLSSQQGLATTRIFMGDSAKQMALLGASKAVLDRIQGTAPATPSGNAFTSFSTNYIARFKVDPAGSAFAANAYDAFYILAMASAVAPGRVPTGTEL